MDTRAVLPSLLYHIPPSFLAETIQAGPSSPAVSLPATKTIQVFRPIPGRLGSVYAP